MDLELEGKVAWVLGASSGLGRASAHSLAREGCAVALSARRPEPLEEATREIERSTGARCLALPLDVTDGDAIARAAETIESTLGPVEVLVANAGGPPAGRFDDLDEESLHKGFTLTTASAWRLAKAVLPGMRSKGGGCIVFITSTSTHEVIPRLLLSNSLRRAVVGLAKTLSKELGPDRVRVLCVAPGSIATARSEELLEARAHEAGKTIEEVRAESEAGIPLGRYGRPEEIGDVTAFLASGRASYMTGVSVVVDGGMLGSV